MMEKLGEKWAALWKDHPTRAAFSVIAFSVLAMFINIIRDMPEQTAKKQLEVISVSAVTLTKWEPLTVDDQSGQVRYGLQTHIRRNRQTFETCHRVDFALELPAGSEVLDLDEMQRGYLIRFRDEKGRMWPPLYFVKRHRFPEECPKGWGSKSLGNDVEDFLVYPKGSEPEN